MLTEQQKLDRKLGVGGSDMAIILGLSSYKTPYQLFLEKTGAAKSDFQENDLIYWGNRLEPLIVDEFSKRNSVIVEQRDTIIHPFHDFMRANVDGFIPEWNSVLEVKTAHQFMAKEWGDPESDVIPMAYLVQVAHYCACLNADSAVIAVLIGGNDYREYKYTRDLELENMVINAAKDFWTCVQTNTQPAPMNAIDLRLMFPTHQDEKRINPNNKIEEAYLNFIALREEMRALEKKEADYKFQIMEFMQDSECLVDATGKPMATWKTNKKGSRTFLLKDISQ